MDRLTKLFVILVLAVNGAGCTHHEARVTGVTQCFAPRENKVASAKDIIQGRSELAAQNAVVATSR